MFSRIRFIVEGPIEAARLQRGFFDADISTEGLHMQNSSSVPLGSTDTFLWDRFRIFEYNNYESILKVFSKKPETNYII